MGNNFSVNNHMGHGGRFGERLADQTMEEHLNWPEPVGPRPAPGGSREKKGEDHLPTHETL